MPQIIFQCLVTDSLRMISVEKLFTTLYMVLVLPTAGLFLSVEIPRNDVYNYLRIVFENYFI